MTPSTRQAVFRRIAQTSFYAWPAYTDTPLYDRSSTGGLAEDVHVLASAWFDHDAHESVEAFVCHWPLAYVEFDTHDRYAGHTRYEMEQLFRAFLIKVLHGWAHETALVTDLETHPDLRQRLDFQTIPDQSTLWRTWQYRFTNDLREFVATAARTILVNAETAGVAVPRKPERTLPRRGRDDTDDASAEERTPLKWTSELTDHVAQFTRSAFSLDRGRGV